MAGERVGLGEADVGSESVRIRGEGLSGMRRSHDEDAVEVEAEEEVVVVEKEHGFAGMVILPGRVASGF